MKYFCYQSNNNDCGFAALKMLLANATGIKSFLYLKKSDKKQDYSFSDLIKEAEKYNIVIKGFSYDDRSLTELRFPNISVINSNHCIVVFKRTKKYVYFLDPSCGKTKMPINEFSERWCGITLEIIDKENPTIPIDKKASILPFKMRAIKTCLSIFSSLSILIGCFFINMDSNLIIPGIFLLLFFSFELVDNWYLIKIINYFDNKYIPLYFNNENSKTKDEYIDYELFKKNYFSNSRQNIATLMTIFTVGIFSGINDFKNIFIIILLMLIFALEKVFQSKKTRSKKKEIAELENKALDSKTQFCENLLRANNKANSFAYSNMIRKSIICFMSIFLAFIMMLVNSMYSSNFVIFYFGIFYVASINIDSLFNSLSEKDEIEKTSQKFVDKCNL